MMHLLALPPTSQSTFWFHLFQAAAEESRVSCGCHQSVLQGQGSPPADWHRAWGDGDGGAVQAANTVEA